MDILEFIFQSFWHFVGTIFLLAIAIQWKPFSSSNQGLSTKQFDKLVDSLSKKKKKRPDSDAQDRDRSSLMTGLLLKCIFSTSVLECLTNWRGCRSNRWSDQLVTLGCFKSYILSHGVTGNTSRFGREESRFEPLWDN